jgi:hypothetical protein
MRHPRPVGGSISVEILVGRARSTDSAGFRPTRRSNRSDVHVARESARTRGDVDEKAGIGAATARFRPPRYDVDIDTVSADIPSRFAEVR